MPFFNAQNVFMYWIEGDCVVCGSVMTGHYLWMFCVLEPVHDTVSDDGMGMLRGDGVCSMWQ